MAMGHVILKEFHVERRATYFADYCREYTDMRFTVTLDRIEVVQGGEFEADFDIEAQTRAAIDATRDEIPKAAAPRILEEINRFCRAGGASDSRRAALPPAGWLWRGGGQRGRARGLGRGAGARRRSRGRPL